MELPGGIEIASRSLAMVAGVLLFLVVLVSLFRTIVIPRALNSTLSQLVMGAVLLTTRAIARPWRTYRTRDAILAWAGPVFIFAILITWLVLLMVAFGLMIFAVGPSLDLGQAISQSGSSMFTLGFAAGRNSDQTVIDFMAAASGPIVIALMISVLANIYSVYLDRERNVALLNSIAGEPAWGPEVLCRTALAGTVESLPERFFEWANWATSVRISHQMYPVLIYVRSPGPRANYAVSLLAMLDAAALKVALNTTLVRHGSYSILLNGSMAMETLYEQALRQQSARASLPLATHMFAQNHQARIDAETVPAISPQMQAAQTAAARDALDELSEAERAELEAGEHQPLVLTREQFDSAYALIKESGFPVDRSADDAWPIFEASRKRYEYPALHLMQLLDALPAPWSGPRKPPMPTIWPNLSVKVYEQMSAPNSSPIDDQNHRGTESP